MPTDRLRALIARRLEAGDGSALARALAAGWERVAARAVARPIRLPQGVHVIGVGGAVLGGAGKTPLAIALARHLAAGGERVALIGHAYRAAPGRARVAAPDDAVTVIGDDALTAARLLEGSGVPVIVAPRRQAALDHAAAIGARTAIADGLLQAAPHRVGAAVLTLDATAPWGSGASPPAGDLRAPADALLAAADHIAAVIPEGGSMPPDLAHLGAVPVASAIEGAVDRAGDRLSLADLAGRRVGLLLAVARPDRVTAALGRAGIHPAVAATLADHAPGRALAAAARGEVDLWLATARCATKLPARLGGAPVLALIHRLSVDTLAAAVVRRTGTDG